MGENKNNPFWDNLKETAGGEAARAGVRVAGQLIAGKIEESQRRAEHKRRMEAIKAFRKNVIMVMVVVLVIAGIGTGGSFLLKKLFFSTPNTVAENAAIVEAAPDLVPETKTAEQETQTTVTASEPGPEEKSGFFQKVGGFFAGIGRAIKGFFIGV
jgi:hypothetical protein